MSYLDTLKAQDPELAAQLSDEHFVLELVDQLHRSMQLQGLRKADLARRLGCSRAAVTRLFDASGNIGVRRLRQVARALNMELVFQLGAPAVVPEKVRWKPLVLSKSWTSPGWKMAG